MSTEVGSVVEGKITSITKFGAFVALPDSKSGMIHISEVSDSFVKDINDYIKIGETVKVKVCSVDERGRIALSLKQVAIEDDRTKTESRKKESNVPDKIVPPPIDATVKESTDFEDMMSRFMKTSNEKISDLKKTMDSKRGSQGFSRKNTKKY